MKNHIVIIALAMAVISSCTAQKAKQMDTSVEAEEAVEAGTKVYCYNDSCLQLVVKLSLELPLGNDSAATEIRKSLVAAFSNHCYLPIHDQEGGDDVEPYDGDLADGQAIVDYYGKAIYRVLLRSATAEHEEQVKYIEEDTTRTEQEKEEAKSFLLQWTFDMSMRKVTDTLGFAVYHAPIYVYTGGAHGSFLSPNARVFDKSTGIGIEGFVRENAAIAMQSLIRKGLVEYYKQCGEELIESELSDHLLIEGSVIPLPAALPYPNATGDSLVFTYQQYEIAPYSDGLPSFALSVKELLPYLTKEGKAFFERTNKLKEEDKE